MITTLWIFFPLAITLHNLEEALWLPRWSHHAKRFHPPVEQNEFVFAVIVVTLLAYLSTFLAMAFPSVFILRLIFFGVLGMMILNAFVPHLAATIVLRRYCPGLVTALFLMVPVNSVILYQAIVDGLLQWLELGLSTLVVAAFAVALLPFLFRLGKLIETRFLTDLRTK
ncbi:MAG: HXXEE domain-containing protein [Chloroflexi bacterium]|nr:HXXEE domain-containing protein [Chloroflexota bacterium]